MQVTRMLSNVFTPVKSVARCVCNTISTCVHKVSLPKPLERDTFQRQIAMDMGSARAKKILDPDLYSEEMETLLSAPCDVLSKDVLQSLSAKQLRQFNKYIAVTEPCLFKQLQKDAKLVALYGDTFQKGLRALVPNGNLKVVAIGQSPAMIVEYLALKGMDTATCPISALKYVDSKTIKEIPNKEKYFQYLKNFGLDVDNIDKTKTYVFTDYEISGASLQNFRRIIEPRLPKEAKVLFVSMQDVIKAAEPKMSFAEKDIVSNFDTEYLCSQDLKRLYSPIFHLPALGIGHIEKLHKAHNSEKCNVNCNKLKVILFDLLRKRGQS